MIDLVFIPGWGMSSAVWQPLVEELQTAIASRVRVHCIDLPGYGQMSDQVSSSDLTVLAQACLDQAPKKAIWVGWSLGGMVAIKAALLLQTSRNDESQSEVRGFDRQILGLQLINTTPCFVHQAGWQCGVDMTVFQAFCDQLAQNYDQALRSFLLLQTGGAKGSRELVAKTMALLEKYPAPSQTTLQAGLDCLAKVDLRGELSTLQLPVQVVSGARDRITHPDSSDFMVSQLPNASHVSLSAGHAPLLTHAPIMAKKLIKFVAHVSGQAESVEVECV